ncbi:MAG: sugar phosphate nucleotidyltransferase, partial [Candidatus Babeliales bacterium]|nr:sugar phosphate nucleotidyltransferase [Candidatus Babeliales bacterium]
ADPFIPQKENAKFAQCLEYAFDFASQHDRITLRGVKPTFAATGYGYIEFDATALEHPSPIKKFHEKPSQSTAQQYLDTGSMLWNIGMFCAKAFVFIDEYKKLAPEIYQQVIDYQSGNACYESIKSDSIDYAIVEKSDRVSVLPVDFAWCDVGNLEIFLSIKDMFGSLNNDALFQTEAHNNLVHVPNKLVALIGVSDLCVVETDQVLLITKRQDAQKVRDIVKLVKQQGFTEYL